MSDSDQWVIERQVGTVAELHAHDVPEQAQRTVRWCQPTNSALVLGRAQSENDVDHDAVERAGIEVVRRRSGGGAVLVDPSDLVWFDVVVPAGDALWSDDVGVAFHWIGGVCARALQVVTGLPVSVHKGALRSSEWSRLICFAGLGPGECTVGGAKVLGVSQRRTRSGARFQCMVPVRFDVDRLLSLFMIPDDDRSRAREQLHRTVAPLPTLDRTAFEAAVLEALPVLPGATA